ncbi:phage integrase N-terminal SAM-like domain-containing protein [Sinobacterium norvegicum]
MAYTTEKTYIHWVKRYIYFHHKQHPRHLTTQHIEAIFIAYGR